LSVKPGDRKFIWLAAISLLLALAVGLATLMLPHERKRTTAPRAHPSRPVTLRHKPPPRVTTPVRPPEPHNSPVPILMYHVIAAPPVGAPYPGLYVRPADFSAEVAMLARHGFHAVTLTQVYRYWKGIEALPPKPVVFSFDDGYRGDYLNAFPVLQAHNWPGVLNMEVANMKVSWGLSPRVLRRMAASGWEIDAHTLTHPNLTTLDDANLERQVMGSREVLEETLRVPVDFFCYPIGRYDDRVIAAVKAAGFLGATTENPGLASPDDLFQLARIRVSGSDSASTLEARLQALGEPA